MLLLLILLLLMEEPCSPHPPPFLFPYSLALTYERAHRAIQNPSHLLLVLVCVSSRAESAYCWWWVVRMVEVEG